MSGGEFGVTLFSNGEPAIAVSADDGTLEQRMVFAPGGTFARRWAARPIVVKVGDTVFVHGGVLPNHVAYGLERMNSELDAWLDGRRPGPPAIVVDEDSPLWTRAYSTPAADCARLQETLADLGAQRMVVGHNETGGIASACSGKVWRVDSGSVGALGGSVEALQIHGEHVSVLAEQGLR
jgi:hypothetical protein